MDETILNEIGHDISKLCRTCLSISTKTMDIFDVSFQSQPTNEIIRECSRVQVQKDDGLPEKICFKCFRAISLWWRFRLKAEESDHKLRAFLAKSSRNIKEEISEVGNPPIKTELIEIDDPLDSQFYSESPPISKEKHVAHFGEIRSPAEDNIRSPAEDKVDTTKQSSQSFEEDDEDDDDDSSDPDFDDDYQPDEKDDSEGEPLEIKKVESFDEEKSTEEKDDNVEDEDFDPHEILPVKKERKKTRSTSDFRIISNFDDEKFDYDTVLTSDNRYKCPFCSKSMIDKKGLKEHMRFHTGKNLKRCSLCDRGFVKQSHLNRHMDTHREGAKHFDCPQCNLQFPVYTEMRKHLADNHGRWWQKKKPELRTYTQIIEAEAQDDFNEKNCLCKICDDTFTKISNLRQHLRSHLDTTTMIEIDLHSKLYLFDLLRITPNIITKEELMNFVISEIQQNSLSRFYQIVTPSGYELQLSDSESENEDTPESKNHSYSCPQCELVFNRSYKINRHVREQHRDHNISHSCADCGRKFLTEWMLQRHRKHQCDNKLKQHFCTTCQLKFMWQHSFDLHNEKVHSYDSVGESSATIDTVTKRKRSPKGSTGGGRYECSTCQKTFMSSYHLSRHEKIHSRSYTRLSCPECSKTFSQQTHLDRHIQELHNPNNDTYECPTCQKSFNNKRHLDRHLKLHTAVEKKINCDHCDEKFTRRDTLRTHLRVAHNVKDDLDSHLCVYCGRNFSKACNLVIHMRRHTGEKPYRCDVCDKGFPRSFDLQTHRRTHTGEKPSLCTICGKGFSRPHQMRRHFRIHTGIRPYKCTYCDRAFTQSNDLTLHIRRHTGEKPYGCGVCGERFMQGTALNAHRRMQNHYEDNAPDPATLLNKYRVTPIV